MTITLAFDVYGTLINTNGVVLALTKQIGEKAPEFSRIWREKQLEYTFRRGLMRNYEPFDTCIKEALEYTSVYFKVSLSQDIKEQLLNTYNNLPTFHDVESSLSTLSSKGFNMYAFSNGSTHTVESLLNKANIRSYFLDIVSVDEIKSYKPNPDVYSHFLSRTNTLSQNAWLISSNPFDVIGAVSYGMRAAWIKRSAEVLYDSWGINPTLTLNSLVNLAAEINQFFDMPNA